VGLTQGSYLAGAALGEIMAMELAIRKPIRGLVLGTPDFPSAEARSQTG